MDALFKDSSLKGPLWEDVSRKLAELGFHRSAKKCKEKFENVYKYHRRTKDVRTSKSEGKTYRFFEQLEALKSNPPVVPTFMKSQASPMVPMPLQITPGGTVSLAKDAGTNSLNPSPPTPNLRPPVQQLPTVTTTVADNIGAYPFANILGNINIPITSSSSETTSDVEPERRKKRKRKWKEFFGRLTKEVVQKQEELQKKFLEALEKRERDRIAREEAWRMQEITKLNREHDLLVHERSVTAAKDTAVIAFLQKLSDQQVTLNPDQIQNQSQNQNHSERESQIKKMRIQVQENYQVPSPLPLQQLPPSLPPPSQTPDGGEMAASPSPSRWPKTEIQALIKLRTTLDMKYQENAPKGPLWEEISASMRKLGYNRNAKRCKEKWENINKYYKKVKESNKKRPEDAKTCPYFHQLEQIYKERAKGNTEGNSGNAALSLGFSGSIPDNNPPAAAAPVMARPEQQWPISGAQEHEHEHEDDNNKRNINNEQEFSEDDEDDEDEANGYEVVTNKTPSMGTNE
jgi:hypothetical protein